ncbi:uncharacterized protein LAESUDRAFT_477909 [Laetiporus sulphureus 93-53]|uniref:Uncharacterized protein n=1 Tax=Laetiporus sulphureus 93-53 TaxID=1314785 RepID=A0A165BQB4_9APHY|nr:uncharacterized protein LAESUDRAFT_477909 [Laetiporus sulphureus 93-53]KZT01461.1 hypothetical protein LAESUDRAFT_477909 [Laetiporus sulphureus 93-53]
MTTPFSTPNHLYPTLASSTVPRAPVINPFDKFPQSDFDAWIGDITGALKRVLGYEVPEKEHAPAPAQAQAQAQDQTIESDREDDVVEDSLAEIKARREAKGKQRATTPGDAEQPIVIGSDSEYEHASNILALEHESEDYEDEDEVHEEEEGQPESDEDEQANDSAGEVNELLSDNEGESEDEELAAQAETKASGIYDEDAGDEEEASEGGSDEIALATEHKPESEAGVGYSHAHYGNHDEKMTVDFDMEEDEKDDDYLEEENEQAEEFPPAAETVAQPVSLPDLWDGPRMFAEDLYSGGDVVLDSSAERNPHVLPPEEYVIERAGNEPEPECKTADLSYADVREYPSSHGIAMDKSVGHGEDAAVQHHQFGTTEAAVKKTSEHVQLPDVWDGVRTYGQDFFTGGDLRESDLRTRVPSPSHLTAADDEISMFLTPEALTPQTVQTSAGDLLHPSVEGIPLSKEHEDRVDIGHNAETEETHAVQDDTIIHKQSSMIEEPFYANSEDLQQGEEQQDTILTEEDSQDVAHAELRQGLSESLKALNENRRSPSPPTLNTHVDWSWPPAFVHGRIETGPGHLQTSDTRDESEVIEISDDEAEALPEEEAPAFSSFVDPKETSEHVQEGEASSNQVTEASTLAKEFVDQMEDLAELGDIGRLSPEDIQAIYADLGSFLTTGRERHSAQVKEGSNYRRLADRRRCGGGLSFDAYTCERWPGSSRKVASRTTTENRRC